MARTVKVIMFYKMIYWLGQNYRNPSLKMSLNFLKKSDNWSLKELEDYQLKKIKELVNFSFKNSSYYNAKLKEFGVSPKDIKTLSDIKKLPIITKQELITKNKEIHTDFKFEKVFKSVTSGSTGTSLEFLREETADSFNRASIYRGYSWYNVNPWEKNGYFWGFNFSFLKKIKTKFLDALQNRFRVFSYDTKEFNSFVKKAQKAKYIHGYSSMIYQASKIINEKGLSKPKGLKMIKGTSEKIFENYHDEVKKAFGLKIISEYGAAETGIIAFECPEGNMHINMEGVYVEEVNNEIIVTNLQMQSFPIIRYKLGDYIRVSKREKKCTCGREHLILDEVTGRVGGNVYGKQQVYPSLVFYYIFKNLMNIDGISLNYQIIQSKKGMLKFKIEQNLSNGESLKLKKEIHKYFKEDMEIEIIQKAILHSFKGKLKSFISEIDE